MTFQKKSTAVALEPKDRVYKLKGNKVPISFVLASRDTKRMRLLYYDEAKNQNRVLRYATNFNSPFQDEQVGEAVLEDIIFEKGMLFVPKTNPALQIFLQYHPENGRSFELVDHEKEAEDEMKELDLQAEAVIKAKQLSLEQHVHMFRVLFGKDPDNYPSTVVMRDVKVYAKQQPVEFLEKAADPALNIQSDIRLMFDRKLLTFRNANRDVHFNLRDNKSRLISVPDGRDPYREVQAFFETEQGLETYAILQKYADEM